RRLLAVSLRMPDSDALGTLRHGSSPGRASPDSSGGVFGDPEGGRGNDLRDDWLSEFAVLGQDLPGLLRKLLLFLVVVEDCGAILRAHIRALAIERGWVVVVPEDVEKSVVAHQRRVVLDLDHLCVSGGVAADLFIGRIWLGSAFVACGRGSNAGNILKGGLRPPE